MQIFLENVSKKFTKDWIIRNFNAELDSSNAYVILGPNGSGKSTLLQMISGFLSPTEGKIEFSKESKKIDREKIYQQISIATPYLELIEELTIKESIDFHFKFKKPIVGFNEEAVLNFTGLAKHSDKFLKDLSSGMRQRVKLSLAVLSDTTIVLLDEPLSNLDSNGVDWYKNMIQKYSQGRLFIVCSNNQHDEFFFCNKQLYTHQP